MGTLINGNYGPYDKSTDLGKSANAGYEVARNIKNGSIFKNGIPDIQVFQKNEEGYSILKTGLAYGKEELKAHDLNDDNKITKFEYSMTTGKAVMAGGACEDEAVAHMRGAEALFTKIDINNDGFITAKENLALTMFQDQNNDGIVTSAEIESSTSLLMDEKAECAKEDIKDIYGTETAQEALQSFFNIADKKLQEQGISSASDLDIKKEQNANLDETSDVYNDQDVESQQVQQRELTPFEQKAMKYREMMLEYKMAQMEAAMDQMMMQNEIKLNQMERYNQQMENYNNFSNTTFGRVTNGLFNGMAIAAPVYDMFGGGYNYDTCGANGLYGNSYFGGGMNMNSIINPFGYAMKNNWMC